ncbi:MAG: type I-E CRISPR-associated protein Cse1/CasA [candidate division Zixibacteria bacterium]|nr:type I-E CRISPR-associated protein Cse1/CasA [candidate division Zixibacteria bacterium]
MELSFNLIEQPWIPCIKLDGSRVRLGIGQTLKEAHTLREVHAQSPLVTVAILRLLLAILHRVYGPPSTDEWCNLSRDSQWDPKKLDDYFSEFDDRFDLFHDKYPFYQVTSMPKDARRRSIVCLVPERASGSNDTLFEHSTDDDEPAFAPSQAACYLLAEHCLGLQNNAQSASCAQRLGYLVDGVQVLIRGDSLRNTCWLNMVVYDGKLQPFPTNGADLPAWERNAQAFQFLKNPPEGDPAGYLDYLTFNHRYIKLHPELLDGELCVRIVQIAQGPKISAGWHCDQFKVYGESQDKKTPIRPMKLRRDRALWRDSDAFIGLRGSGHQSENVRRLASEEAFQVISKGTRLNLDIFGVANFQSAIYLWRHERLPLPLPLLRDDECRTLLGVALRHSENTGFALKQTVNRLNRHLLLRQGAAGKVNPPIDPNRAVGAFWSELDVPFYGFLSTIVGNPTASLETWAVTTRNAAFDAFSGAVAKLRFTANALQAIAVCEQQLRSQLYESQKEISA